MSYPQTCQCKEDWTDGTGICQECHLKRINTQADLHAVVDFIRETEKLEAQVAEWMGVANQQILRIQELEKERDSAQALARQAVKVMESQRCRQCGNSGVTFKRVYDAASESDERLEKCTACAPVRAFLDRSDVKAMGGRG